MTIVPESLTADPGAADAHAAASRVLDELASVRRPSRAQAAAMAEHALLWAGLGLAERAGHILRAWRKAGRTSAALRRAEIVQHVTASPAAAAAQLRELGAADPQIAALDVVNHLFRGELAAAIAIAREHGWFVADDDLTHGMFHAVWALALDEQFATAREVVEAWKRRLPRRSPIARQFALRTEAGLAGFESRHAEEERLVEEALALCVDHDLGIARVYTEPSVVGARARAGAIDRGRALARTWPRRRRAARGPIESFRDVAALELHTLADAPARAATAGRRCLGFWERTGHAVMTCFVRLRLALAAAPETFGDELAELRRVVRRCPIRYYAQRLAVLDELLARGYASARDVRLAERSRHERLERPLARLWTPPVTALGADVFWNRTTGSLHFAGRGPFSLADRPVLRRMLEEVLRRPGFTAPVSELFAAVWGGTYNPLVHEGKLHVTTHRLRRWLDDCVPGGARLVETADGAVAIAPGVDVRVLEPVEPGVASRRPHSVRERVLQCVEADAAPLAPGELVRRLGVSRSAVNAALRALVADGRIARHGAGRATRYARRRRARSSAGARTGARSRPRRGGGPPS